MKTKDQKILRKRKVNGKKGKVLTESETRLKKVKRSPKEEEKQKSGSIKPKEFTKHETRCARLTEWIEWTIKELYDIGKTNKDNFEEETCPICLWELYDDLESKSSSQIDKMNDEQLKDPKTIDCIKFNKCANHFYHKGWADALLGNKSYVKCAVWSTVYGDYIGDMPTGKMSWKYHSPYKLETQWQVEEKM